MVLLASGEHDEQAGPAGYVASGEISLHAPRQPSGPWVQRRSAGHAADTGVPGKQSLAELPYLSPEHVDPDGTVDDLSDQYCLGAVAYALLTGRPPCEGGTPAETVEFIREAVPLRAKEACPGLPDRCRPTIGGVRWPG